MERCSDREARMKSSRHGRITELNVSDKQLRARSAAVIASRRPEQDMEARALPTPCLVPHTPTADSSHASASILRTAGILSHDAVPRRAFCLAQRWPMMSGQA